MVKELQADLSRYHGAVGSWGEVAGNPAVWSLVWYRFGHWIYKGSCPSLIRLPLKLVHKIGYMFCEAVLQMAIDPGATIGEGLFLGHTGGIRLHPDVVIGKNCDLSQHVTIGAYGVGRKGVPVLGDNVYVGTGAVVIGNISVGNSARIAANTLVTKDVPAGATVMGVPGTIVKQRPVVEASN